MKKFIEKKHLYAAVLIALAVIIMIGIASNLGNKYDEEKAGREVCISFLEVNFRETHSTHSEVLEVLIKNELVTLTGNQYNGLSQSWMEVQYKGMTGWIAAEAIQW